MKKHNEGYALVLVLVVITVLCLVALAMMAASLKNLQNQQTSIDRMEAKYQAQGQIEQYVADLEEKIAGGTMEIHLSAADSPLCTGIDHVTTTETDDYLLIHLKAEADGAQVSCTIKVSGNIHPGVNGTYPVDAKGLKWEYVSYTVTHSEGGGGE